MNHIGHTTLSLSHSRVGVVVRVESRSRSRESEPAAYTGQAEACWRPTRAAYTCLHGRTMSLPVSMTMSMSGRLLF